MAWNVPQLMFTELSKAYSSFGFWNRVDVGLTCTQWISVVFCNRIEDAIISVKDVPLCFMRVSYNGFRGGFDLNDRVETQKYRFCHRLPYCLTRFRL